MRAAALLLPLLLLGCEYVERPRRGLPEHFAARTLTGEEIDRATLTGHPWAVVIWVPG